MKQSIFKAVTIIMLSLSLGMHWTVLQSVAWFSMIVSYSQEGSLQDAVIKTFDGEHPCQLCFLVRSGKEAETKEKQFTFHVKHDLFFPDTSESLVAVIPFLITPSEERFPIPHPFPPLIPPPRISPV